MTFNIIPSPKAVQIVGMALMASMLLLTTPTKANSQTVSPKLDAAVSHAIISARACHLINPYGETPTEGHIIFETVKEGNIIKVYGITSYGAFGFEDGVFTHIGGGSRIPAVITFTQNQNNGYTLLNYQEPQDGSKNSASIRKMFPKRLHYKIIESFQYSQELDRQQEAQARQYLQRIGRDAKVDMNYAGWDLIDIPSEAMDKLLKVSRSLDRRLNNCPLYWYGATERVENNVRYIYETAKGQPVDNHEVIIFRIKNAAGAIIAEYRYKIAGTEPLLVSQFFSPPRRP